MVRPILILLPSLNRPARLAKAIESLCETGTGLWDLLVLQGPGGYVSAINSVPKDLLSQYEILGLVGDDFRMGTKSWDKLVFDALSQKWGLLYGRDGIFDQNISTHSFISTRIPIALGFIQPPCLQHWHGDLFLMEVARGLGRLYYNADLLTEHLHYSHGKSEQDDTNRFASKSWDEDTAAWNRYKSNDLPSVISGLKSVLL